jgi:3'(2'), 5'-bisphosphate nucleotidase
MISQPELKHLLLVAINSALNAGSLIMDVYSSDDFQVNLKSDATPLTLADRKAHLAINDALMKTRIPVMSEEGRGLLYEEREGWEYFWLVDPLDGTKEFIKRNGEFTVNIALIYNNYPIAGVVFVPTSKQLYYSLQGNGAYKVDCTNCISKEIKEFETLLNCSYSLPSTFDLPEFTIAISRSHQSKQTQEFIENLKKKHQKVNVIAKGSSLKICMVAEGIANIYPRFGVTTEWDTAAAQAIAEEAGCQVLSMEDGKRLKYNKENTGNPWFIVKRL